MTLKMRCRSLTLSFRVTSYLCLALLSSTASVACGDDTEDGSGDGGRPASGGGASGARAEGGASSGAEAGRGGSATTEGGNGGAPGAGDEAGAGGRDTVEPGGPCTENCPKGNVASCYDDCPLGACDNEEFFASTPCSSLYPAPVDDETVWCAKGVSAKYCLTVVNADIDHYVVTCDGGTPDFEQCSDGCRTLNGEASCND